MRCTAPAAMQHLLICQAVQSWLQLRRPLIPECACRWCLCAGRWKQAKDAGKAPKVVLASTSEKALKVLDLDLLKQYAA